MDMDMSVGMTDCPFMSHTETICPMSVFDHMEAVKSVFMGTVATLVVLLLAGVVGLRGGVVPANLPRKLRQTIPLFLYQLKHRTYAYYVRALQDLYSNGVLNPKLFSYLP